MNTKEQHVYPRYCRFNHFKLPPLGNKNNAQLLGMSMSNAEETVSFDTSGATNINLLNKFNVGTICISSA